MAKTITIHCASIEHRHGTNHYAALDNKLLYQQLAEYCNDEWHDFFDAEDDPIPEDNLTCVEKYFEKASEPSGGREEFLDTSTHEIVLPQPYASAPELHDLLTLALPYVEEAAEDPVNKPGPVKALAKRIRAAIDAT